MFDEIERFKNKTIQYDNTVFNWDNRLGIELELITYILSLFDKNKKLSKLVWYHLTEFDFDFVMCRNENAAGNMFKYLSDKNIEIEIIGTGSDFVEPLPVNKWGFVPKITSFNYATFIAYKNHFHYHNSVIRDYLIKVNNTFLIDNCGLRPDVTEYKHYFTSLNNKPHPHRIQTMDLLAKYDLIDSNAISWHSYDIPLQHTDFQIWKPKMLRLSDDYQYPFSCNNIPNEYLDSFAQLITETSMSCFYISEKTLLPLMIGKPFIACNIQGFHKILKRLGFELYDEIFDYSFDVESDQEKRFDMAIQNFVELSKIPKKDLKHLYNKVRDKLFFNRTKTLAIPTDINSYPDEIKEAIYYQIKNNLPLLPFVDSDIKL